MIFGMDTYSSRLAIIADDGTRLTYGELAERVAARAKELQKGVLQFCLCRNSIESIVEYLACLEAGAPVVLLDDPAKRNVIRIWRYV